MRDEFINLLTTGVLETLYMTLISTALSYLLGIPLGVLLYITSAQGLRENRFINVSLGFIVNILRSAPFIILLIVLMPLTRLVVGTTIGSTAMILPLVIASTPFVGRMVESSLLEVPKGVIEAALSMGCTHLQMIGKVLLLEARPALLTGATITITSILSYSAMAGFVGGGGLGTIAINYGLYRYETGIMLLTLILLIGLVQIFQFIGVTLVKRTDKRKTR